MLKIRPNKSLKNLTNQQIRDYLVSTFPNGQYIEWICSNCGNYSIGPEFDTDECKIVNKCKECFDKKEGK